MFLSYGVFDFRGMYGARQLAQRGTWLIQGETKRITHLQYDHSADIKICGTKDVSWCYRSLQMELSVR